jgi:mono/diheme cytochrome c family protein
MQSMKGESHTLHMIVGLILTVAVTVGMSYAMVSETTRMETKTAELEKQQLRRGRELYVANCTSCHGSRGEGIVGPSLNNKILLKAASDKVLFETIRVGRPGTNMPAWSQENGGPLTDEDIRNVVSFVKAWEKQAPVVQPDVYVPTASKGAALFDGTCFICHGKEGHGGPALAINDPARLIKLDDDWYRQTIMNGRPAKGMPTWGTVLSPNQVEDLIMLIRAWRGGEKVATESTVAEMLNSALFSLSQGDAEDTLFYLERARPIAFGPALERFSEIETKIKGDQLNDALKDLGQVYQDWPTGEVEPGATIFKDACVGCHGSEGQGGVGRRLKPSQFIQDSNNSQMLQLLLTGRPGTAMRSFDGRLTERQLADVIAFLRTWQTEKPAEEAAPASQVESASKTP